MCKHCTVCLECKIERLTRRVAALEMVIAEEMHPEDCRDDMNRMVAEEIHERHSQSFKTGA